MFGWLFGKKKNEEGFDFYSPKERKIYRYFDGRETVFGDPMAIYKRLMNHGKELDIDLKVAVNYGGVQSTTAHNKAVERVRDIFALKSLGEGGLTESEAMDLLDHFLAYIDSLKKNSSHLQTFSISSREPSDSSNGNPDISSSSESGSTAAEPSIARPEPSLTA